jgi:SAM-dependent methyltransferase
MRIYDAYVAGRQSAALASAVHVGLFDVLAERALTPEALAQRLGAKPRPVALLARVLVAMGLLVQEGDRLALAHDTARYLVRGRPDWLGGLIELEVESFLDPRRVLDALERDAPSVYDGDDPWQVHQQDPARAQAFTEAMHSISASPARALARVLDLRGATRLLDVGGGSGVFAIELARAHPALRVTLFDLPEVCALAEGYVQRAGLSDRIDRVGGDLFREALPGDFEAALLSQILHDWPPARCAELLAAVHTALRPSGRVFLHEKLIRDDGTGPLANHLVDLDMLVWTEGQQWSEAGLVGLLEAAGFRHEATLPTEGYWSVVIGRKA